MPHRKPIGLVLSFLSSVFARLSGFATQVITAWYLTPSEFGLYAIAVGITTFTMIMRGGGTGIVYQTLRPEEYSTHGGALLRIGIFFGIIGAVFTAGAAMPALEYYGQASLGWLLLWMAALFLVTHLSLYPRAKMASHLRFKEIATIDLIAAILKLGTAFFCAQAGWGAFTFVFAQLAAVILQLVATSCYAHFSRTDFSIATDWFAPTVRMLQYPLLLSVMISLMDQIDAFTASFFVPITSLGLYFFAVQLVIQPTRLITNSIGSVLAPFAARARGDLKAENAQIAVAFKTGVVFAPLLVLSIPAVYPGLQRVLWGDRWETSVLPVMIAACLLIYPTIQWVLEGPVIGLRRWKTYFRLLSWRAGSKVVGVLLAIAAIKVFALPEHSIALSLVVGVGVVTSVTSYFQVRRVLNEIKFDRSSMNAELHLAPVYSILAVLGTNGLVTSILQYLVLANDPSRETALLNLTLSAVIYGTISIALLRFAYLDKLQLVIALLPLRVRTVVYKALVLPDWKLDRATSSDIMR